MITGTHGKPLSLREPVALITAEGDGVGSSGVGLARSASSGEGEGDGLADGVGELFGDADGVGGWLWDCVGLGLAFGGVGVVCACPVTLTEPGMLGPWTEHWKLYVPGESKEHRP
ncbi:MAG: hypothetical protein QOE92_1234 [Chloroflexota bacterium]|jgi:hypothetical protein|nr:hypothetical protein [Chloroflexota bacterium]